MLQRFNNTNEYDRNAYARRFGVPRWNRTVTVCEVPRLFRRLPEFAHWSKSDHVRAAKDWLIAAVMMGQQYDQAVADALERFGDQGSLISGVVREHFPRAVKDRLRVLAHETTSMTDRSRAHWQAAGKWVQTWRTLREHMQKEYGRC